MEQIDYFQAGLWMFFNEALKLIERNDGKAVAIAVRNNNTEKRYTLLMGRLMDGYD